MLLMAGKISPARHEQRALAHPGKGRGEALRVGQRGQLGPVGRGRVQRGAGCKSGRGGAGEEHATPKKGTVGQGHGGET